MTSIDRLYILTTTLLLAHQIDSAYWHEWNLFGIPGGIQGFLLLNVLIMLPFLSGLAEVTKGTRAGSRFALALAFVGVATFFIHVWFAMQGHRKFDLPTSWVILFGTLLSSPGLAWGAVGECRRTSR